MHLFLDQINVTCWGRIFKMVFVIRKRFTGESTKHTKCLRFTMQKNHHIQWWLILTCSPAHQYTPSSSSCSPGQTAYCESFCVFSLESFLHTDWQSMEHFHFELPWDKTWELVVIIGGSLPLWEVAGWVGSPLPLLKASSRLHWESTLVWTVGRGVGADG